ncbi:MAG: LysR family transcriptional regulator [Oceanospirillaceae bacterium]|nr:LysR family transcriptional regulator [Oceanospirillaceae bacterium]
MRLEWLHTFIDVSETRNFNRTAERLQITQSTVSSRIRALEEELDINLFIRGRGGATLTPEGIRLLSYAKSIRMTWNLALGELKGPKNYRGSVKIAAQISIWEQLVSEWLTGVRKALPKIAINMEAYYSNHMREELRLGNLDIGVLYAPEYQSNIEVEHLFNEKFVMIATQPMKISQVNQENYIFLGLTNYFKERHSELLPHLQSAAVSMGLSVMSLEYLKANGGASYFSQRQAQKMINKKEIFIVEGAPIIEQPVFVTYLSKHRHSLVVTEILNVLRTLM